MCIKARLHLDERALKLLMVQVMQSNHPYSDLVPWLFEQTTNSSSGRVMVLHTSILLSLVPTSYRL